MSFRITTLLYIFALLAAAMAVFGAWGLLIGTAAAVFWISRVTNRAQSGIALLVASVTVFVLLAPYVETAREEARCMQCLNNIKKLFFCIQNYENTYKHLPPAVGSEGTSGEKQSWRLLTLPFLESSPLFSMYNMNEPWDGPKNSALGNASIHQCPSHGSTGLTSYLAITGPQTAWGDGEKRMFDDITDEYEQTILLIDTSAFDVGWLEPRDLTFDQALELLTKPIDTETFDGHFKSPGMFRKPFYSRNVAMADGSVQRLRAPLDRETATALLTARGGEVISPETLESLGEPEWRYDKLYGLAVLVGLALLPVYRPARRRIWPTRVAT